MRWLLACLLQFFAFLPSYAQTIHLAPLPEAMFPTGAALLRIKMGAPPAPAPTHILTRSDVQIRIASGNMYISSPGVELEIIELGDRTIAEFMSHLRKEFAGLELSSEYPELSTNYLQEGAIPKTAGVFKVGGRRAAPTVEALLGVGFTLNEVRSDANTNRLFQNGGFHLDLVGTKQYRDLAVRARIGFRSGEALTVARQSEEGATDEGDDDDDPQTASVTSFVETAERITLGGYLDWTITRPSDDMLIGFGMELAGTWNALAPFVFPTIPVDTVRQPVEELFDSLTIARARERLDRIVPLASLLVGPKMVVGPREDALFYGQVEVGLSQDPVRSFAVRYQVETDSTGRPVRRREPIALFPVTRQPFEPIWRVGVGAKLAGVVDLRVDAVGQLWRRDHEIKPLLRLLIGSDLAISR